MEAARKQALLDDWEAFLEHHFQPISYEEMEGVAISGRYPEKLLANHPELRSLLADPRKYMRFDNPEDASRFFCTATDEEFIEFLGPIYELTTCGFNSAMRRYIMDWLLDLIQDISLTVDIGSGPAYYPIFLKSRGLLTGQIIGIEPCRSWFPLAGKLAAEEHVEVEMVEAWAQSLPFADNSIPQILCLNALPWSVRWREWIKESARVLAPDGRMHLAYALGNSRRKISQMDAMEAIFAAGLDIDGCHANLVTPLAGEFAFLEVVKREKQGLIIATSF